VVGGFIMPNISLEESKGVHIVTTSTVPGYENAEVKGLVWASSVRAKFILQDLVAMLRIIKGGEVHEYWELMNEARHDILQKLNKNAVELGANAIVSVKLVTSQVVPGTVEILAYGTAVVLKKKK
jgi:uncharacterized protein YbjQ (UPF0145 family)